MGNTAKAFIGLLFLLVALIVSIFLPSGTLNYLQAWIYLFVFAFSVILITLYLIKNDPKLLERRLKAGVTAEKEKSHCQKVHHHLVPYMVVVQLFL
jgi:FtsH-binding integral membrane protein